MLLYGIPLCVVVVLLVLGTVYKEDLRQAGLLRTMRATFVLLPVSVLALFVALRVYLSARDEDPSGERRVSRATARKRAMTVTLLFVVFPLLPVFVIYFRRAAEIDFATILLYGVCIVTLQLIWPLMFRATCDRDPALEAELRDRVIHLAQASGVLVEDLIVATTDDDDDPPNAFICGMGRSRLVVIEQRLAAMLEPEELDAVVAHEFAHASEHHIAKRVALYICLAAGLAALDRVAGEATPGSMLLLFSALVLCVLLKFAFDRRLELAADRKAAEWVGALNVRNALARLATDHPPSKIPRWLATHPPLPVRILCLERMCRPPASGLGA